MLHERGMRSARLGLAVNASLAAVKFAAGVLGNSYALIADGIESTTDIASSLIVWGGLRLAAVPPDEGHPYGHGRAEAIAAAAVSLTLIGAAAGMAVAAVREIITPHSAPEPYTLAVLVAVILVKELLFRRVHAVGEDIGSQAVKTDAWHHRSDAITSAAAFVGILVSVAGGPGWEAADDWAALIATAIIAWNGVRLLLPAVHEFMDRAYEGPEKKMFIDVALSVEGVQAVEKIRVRKLGMHFHVDMHIHADGALSLEEAHAISGRVKSALRGRVHPSTDASIHMEPFRQVLR
ncbi:MAG: cation diffusion facilitator family transporter [Candidatus Peribacteraceae bacterium]|nr:cation diffusion facilitator family transporter [Candidatus Peribacteraceae bacterium]